MVKHIMAAAEASVSNKAEKRVREDDYLQEIEANQHKRPCHSLLWDCIFEEDIDTLDIIKDETVLHVIKCLEEETSITDEISKDKVKVGRIEASVASYEYLASATDEELGIPPSPPAPLQENEGQHIPHNIWSDLFENSSDQKVDLSQPFYTYFYFIHCRDFELYGNDIPDSDAQKWFPDEASTDSLLEEWMGLF